jgi:glutamate racemase
MDTRPVGMFDSGVGGLSVLREFQRLASQERVIYFADTDYFPYGPRPAAEVRKRAFAIVHRLLSSDAKLIVVACNTASAAAIEDLRQAWDVPFVGMVPGLKPAAQRSQSGVVAILATEGTLDGELFSRVVDEFGRGTKVLNAPGEGLATLVEHGELDTAAVRAALHSALDSPVKAGADTVVLGCTHYHFLESAIRAEFPGVSVVDTAEPVARRAVQLLQDEGLAAPPGNEGHLDLIVTGDRERFVRVMEQLGFPHHQEAAPR